MLETYILPWDDLLFALVGTGCVIAGLLSLVLLVVMVIEIAPDEARRFRAWLRLKRMQIV